jgi:hypothetical protein
MVMFDFKSTIASLEAWGLMDVLLPFLLIFVVVFAILQKTQILGKDKKNFNVIISLVISLMVIIPHVLGTYPAGFDVINIINMVVPQISLIIVAILMLLILLGIFGGASIPGIVAIIAGVVVVAIFLGTTSWLYGLDWLYDFFGTEAVSFLIVILIFGLIIWFITAEPGKGKVGENIGKFLTDVFKGKSI